jgi:hypothetical protein
MLSKPIIILLVLLTTLGSIGYVGARLVGSDSTVTTAPPVANNTTVNGTIVVSQTSQDLIIVRNKTGNNSTTPSFGGGTPVRITQVTPSGRIPHIVEVTDGTNTVQLYAYCVEPSQRAVSGSSLSSSGVEQSAVILKTAKDSDPSDTESARSAQMKIWVLESGGSTDTGQGEASAYAAGMTSTQLQGNLTQAKNEIMSDYKVTEDQIGNLADYKPVDMMGTAMVSNFAVTVQSTLKINPKKLKINITNNTTANNTTNQTNQTNVTNNTQNNNSGSNNGSTRILYMIMNILKL